MNCEEVRIAAMAIADGEMDPLPREVVDEHAASCEACRRAIAGLAAVEPALAALRRAGGRVDLWPAVEARLGSRRERRALLWLAALLTVYKLIEFVPARDFGTWVQLAPLAIAAAVFVLIKQNPFQINAALARHGGEEG